MALVEGEEGRLTPDSLAALLSRPWLINRVTCGTIVTWSKVDAATHDTIVSLDVCLLGLITANIFLFGPLLLSRAAGLSSPGLGTMMGSLQKRYDTLLVPLLERYDNLHVPPPLDLQTSHTTFLEAAAQQILQLGPLQNSLKLANGIKQMFAPKGDITLKKHDKGDVDALSLQRLPVKVYKFPVGQQDIFGLGGFQDLETEVGQVVDLSLATDQEKVSFYRLPRREEGEGGEETGGALGQAWQLLLAELGRAVSVQTLQP